MPSLCFNKHFADVGNVLQSCQLALYRILSSGQPDLELRAVGWSGEQCCCLQLLQDRYFTTRLSQIQSWSTSIMHQYAFMHLVMTWTHVCRSAGPGGILPRACSYCSPRTFHTFHTRTSNSPASLWSSLRALVSFFADCKKFSHLSCWLAYGLSAREESLFTPRHPPPKSY